MLVSGVQQSDSAVCVRARVCSLFSPSTLIEFIYFKYNYLLLQCRADVRIMWAYSASCLEWEDLDSSWLESVTIDAKYQSFGLCFQWKSQEVHHSAMWLPGEFYVGKQEVLLLGPDLHLLSKIIFKKLVSWSWWRDLQMFQGSFLPGIYTAEHILTLCHWEHQDLLFLKM